MGEPDEKTMQQMATLQAMKNVGWVDSPEFKKRSLKIRDAYFGSADDVPNESNESKRR